MIVYILKRLVKKGLVVYDHGSSNIESSMASRSEIFEDIYLDTYILSMILFKAEIWKEAKCIKIVKMCVACWILSINIALNVNTALISTLITNLF